MVALGFAAFENVKYVYSYGFATGLVRAIICGPAISCPYQGAP